MIAATKVYSVLFTHCCFTDLVWVVHVAHSGMRVPVLLVPNSTNNTCVVLANSSNWPVVSAIQAGLCFVVVTSSELMGMVKLEQ